MHVTIQFSVRLFAHPLTTKERRKREQELGKKGMSCKRNMIMFYSPVSTRCSLPIRSLSLLLTLSPLFLPVSPSFFAIFCDICSRLFICSVSSSLSFHFLMLVLLPIRVLRLVSLHESLYVQFGWCSGWCSYCLYNSTVMLSWQHLQHITTSFEI